MKTFTPNLAALASHGRSEGGDRRFSGRAHGCPSCPINTPLNFMGVQDQGGFVGPVPDKGVSHG